MSEPKFNTQAAQYAIQFVNSTNRHVFLTGKAGTGKTTLLRHLVKNTHKNTVVAAPTGIAAINAKGVTLHSLFHLPFGCYVPVNGQLPSANIQTAVTTPSSLIKGLQMNKHKREMIRAIELLIIDEVSMLRADLLDAIDNVLRYVRRRHNEPFGGVQLLFIGDLMQLPPVIKENEKPFLSPFYHNLYFFNARALQYQPPVYIELEKIFRQSDQTFINILNHFRENTLTDDDITAINKCYRPGFNMDDHEGYIHLTTHNRKADTINQERLDKLSTKAYTYKAEVNGDFNESAYPIEEELILKKEAQVMFIKNDPSGEGQFYNGKLGKISALSKSGIEVSFTDGSPSVTVEKYVWENKRFTLNKESGEIEEKVIGTFSHFPLRLAWAITIHKSQGLTFNKAIIDVSQAFAPGQMYVALSRLTGLEGLVLNRPIHEGGPDIELEVVDFSKTKKPKEQLDQDLRQGKLEYLKQYALNSFDFSGLINTLQEHIQTYDKTEGRSNKQKHLGWAQQLKVDTLPLYQVAAKFLGQLQHITRELTANAPQKLLERLEAAQKYFTPLLEQKSQHIFTHIKEVKKESGMKKYLRELGDLEHDFFLHLQRIDKSIRFTKAIIENKDISKQALSNPDTEVKRQQDVAESKKKAEKKTTKQVSYELFLSGMNIEQIARERTLTEGTIENHLAYFVLQGKIRVEELMDSEKAQQIETVFKTLKTTDLVPVMGKLGDEFTYGELRLVKAKLQAERSGVIFE